MSMMDPERDTPPGAIETGLWCNVCYLPSAMRWPLKTFMDGQEMQYGTVIICADCSAHVDEEGFPKR